MCTHKGEAEVEGMVLFGSWRAAGRVSAAGAAAAF
jgi:hypothetical protein